MGDGDEYEANDRCCLNDPQLFSRQGVERSPEEFAASPCNLADDADRIDRSSASGSVDREIHDPMQALPFRNYPDGAAHVVF
jgi:hypothetical protein